MLNTLMCLIPEQAWLPLMVLAGILIILGFRNAGSGIVVTILLLALLGPIAAGLMEALPTPLFFLLILCLPFFLFRMLSGRRVSENVLSYFIWSLIKAPFRFLAWLLRSPARRP